MTSRIFSLILIFILVVEQAQSVSILKHSNHLFQQLKEIKEKVQHGTQCLPPSKYFAGSCYTYMNILQTTSWEGAYNNCLALPLTTDASLLVIDSLAEYEFVARELIGPKSGSNSVLVYVGLRKVNEKWLWLNDTPLRETSVYRYWDNKEILGYNCGALWFTSNISVLTTAACAEQSPHPYVCKHTTDRCYNNNGGCGKYGTCVNLPLLNSYKCQCRFLYSGVRCEEWSSEGLQAIIGSVLVVIGLIASYAITLDRSEKDQWSFRASTAEHYQTTSVYGPSRHTSYMPRSPTAIDRALRNSCLPAHPDFVDASTPIEKHRHWRFSSSSTPPPIPPPIERKHRYSFRLSVQELQVTSHLRSFFIKPKRLILVILPITLTIIITVIIVHARSYIKNNTSDLSLSNATRLFSFCKLYDNYYYANLVTLPIAVVIIILIIFDQTRINYCRSSGEKNDGKFSIYTPIPFNPFSKVNRFDTMILCGIVSHEILQIIEEIFLGTTKPKAFLMRGPLGNLIQQIGLVIMIGLRYYPVYTVVEMPDANFLYYALCALYMWIDFVLRVIEQSYCVNIGPLIKTWQRFQQFKSEMMSKLTTDSLLTTTMMMMHSDHEPSRGGGSSKGHLHKLWDRMPIRKLRAPSTTILPALQANAMNSNPIDSIDWSSMYLNFSSSSHRNESESTFAQFNIDSSIIGALKYAPYYLCFTYICLRLTYLFISKLYHLLRCCEKDQHNFPKQTVKHIYHEPDQHSSQKLSIEYRYVRHLLQKTQRILVKNNTKISFIKSLFYKIYRPNKYFYYSKQILNMYMIAFMLTYYLTFNILQAGFYIIEKIYSVLAIPLIVLSDKLDLPEPKPSNLKYEILITCFLTAIVYYGQLLWGMKNYQKHMLDAYKGIFIDIPPRTAFTGARLISQHAHYSGYCIAYLGFGYITMGNTLFIAIIIIRAIFKQLFLVEQIAKIVIPILVIYLFKMILMWALSRALFLQRHGKVMALRNLRSFFIFSYFNFFFDCFLGVVSCGLRVSKASLAALIFLPRLDYCIFGRALEKMDPGFISYVSFIHMECLHTHPVLIYYSSLVKEKIEQRSQYSRSNKRELRNLEMNTYARRHRATFRWWLAYTLIRNSHLTQLRKHQITHFQLSNAESFNEFLERTVFNRFQTMPTKLFLSKSQRTLQTGGSLDSNTVIQNHTTGCTSLLLHASDREDRKSSI